MGKASFSHFRSESFVARLRALDPKALEEVVCAYTGHLYRAGLGTGLSDEMAHEVCHNTWTTFFEIVKRFEGKSHVRTFLFGIFYNKIHELRRSNKKFEQFDPIDDVMESSFKEDGHWDGHRPPKDPGLYAEQAELIKMVEKCLENLPLNQRAVFTLKILEEEEADEICNILDISSTNLRQLLFRGKNRIKSCVESLMTGGKGA